MHERRVEERRYFQQEVPIVSQIGNLVDAMGPGDVDEHEIKELLQVLGESLTRFVRALSKR